MSTDTNVHGVTATFYQIHNRHERLNKSFACLSIDSEGCRVSIMETNPAALREIAMHAEAAANELEEVLSNER